jgi:hypothetical protein
MANSTFWSLDWIQSLENSHVSNRENDPKVMQWWLFWWNSLLSAHGLLARKR